MSISKPVPHRLDTRSALRRMGWIVGLAMVLLVVMSPLMACGPRTYRVGYYHGGYYQQPYYQPAPYYQVPYYYRAPRYQPPSYEPYRGVRPYYPHGGAVIVAPPAGRGPPGPGGPGRGWGGPGGHGHPH